MSLLVIAETSEENAVLDGVSALLSDLGIVITTYRLDEAFALTLWSASELSHVYADRFNLSREEAVALLEELEPFLQAAAATAGVRLIDRALEKHHSRLRSWAVLPNAEDPGD